MTDVLSDLFTDTIQSIGRWIVGSNKDVINVMRQPTPIKITYTAQASGGIIGGGLANPQPITLWQAPMSHEAWINRFTVTSPSGTPSAPLSTGQALITGSTSGELLYFLPVAGTVAPVQVTEGRLSAPHLNPGEQIQLVADGLPATALLRFDFQIVLVSGISVDTPRTDRSVVDIMP